ncbi:GTA-gp10 family protein, partial [Serratia ureilytica]|uniref:GTA-gp10 family protein n=1 Tax=Serratia ureilytica TaxID=300181 RepID=UPI00235FB4C3
IVGAGLRGAGHTIADEAVAGMRAEGGLKGFVDIVARLLKATFGVTDPPPVASPAASPASPSSEVPANRPFPGTT